MLKASNGDFDFPHLIQSEPVIWQTNKMEWEAIKLTTEIENVNKEINQYNFIKF